MELKLSVTNKGLSPWSGVVGQKKMSGTLLGSQTARSSGIHSLSFTPTSSTATIALNALVCYTNPSTILMWVNGVGYSQASGYTLVPTLVQIKSVGDDRYEFGYNGQMKVDEVAGTGNWYTAKYWEYGTREATRKNPDPVRKPNQSPYSVFSGNPIWKVDPDGDDDYYNKGGKFIGSDGIGTKIRLMDNDAIQNSKSFAASLALAHAVKIDIGKARDMPGMSRMINFSNDGGTFKQMYKDAHDGAERGTYIVLDAKNAEVRAQGMVKGEKGTNEEMMLGSGSKLSEDITILSTVHTNQQEEGFMKKGVSDNALFESQYTGKENSQSDGDMAHSANQNRYSIGLKNVNYYSPEGKGKSANNAGSRTDLESVKYNIGKESLQNYGTQKPQENNLNVLLLLCIGMSFLLGSCNGRSKEEKEIEAIKARMYQQMRDTANKMIIYHLKKEATYYIKDSVMSPELCSTIDHCAITQNPDNYHTTIQLYYKILPKNISDIFVINHTNRFLEIDSMYIPIVFGEDFSFGDIPKDTSAKWNNTIHDGMEFATIQLDGDQNLIKALNFLMCNGKPVYRIHYGKKYRPSHSDPDKAILKE